MGDYQQGFRKSYHNNEGQSGGNNFNRDKKKPEEPGFYYKPVVITGGSDEMPSSVQSNLKSLIHMLEKNEFIIRTSCTKGVETTVMSLCDQSKVENYLPWKGFDDKMSKFMYLNDFIKDLIRLKYNNFDDMKPARQGFIGKAFRLVLGQNGKSHAKFVVVYSSDGVENSSQFSNDGDLNTKMIVEICEKVNIPVINLHNSDALSRIEKMISHRKESHVEKETNYADY